MNTWREEEAWLTQAQFTPREEVCAQSSFDLVKTFTVIGLMLHRVYAGARYSIFIFEPCNWVERRYQCKSLSSLHCTQLCSPSKQQTSIQTLITYLLQMLMEVHITVSTSSSVCSKQTAGILSLQNMQYVQWHLQATIKKRQIMNLKGKKTSVIFIFSAKTPADRSTDPNTNSLVIKCLPSGGVKCRPACEAVKKPIHYCCALWVMRV